MYKIILFVLFLFPVLLSAQKRSSYLSLEGGGNGIVASANFGKTVLYHTRFKIVMQAGLGWTPSVAEPASPFNIPAQFSFNFGQKSFFLEAGLGSTWILKSKLHQKADLEGKGELYMAPILGFRHESETWFGRIYACPLFYMSGEHISDEVTRDAIKFGIGIGAIL